LEKIELKIVTPDRQILAEQVDDVVLPTTVGSMGVLPGHAPLLAQLDVGEVSYKIGRDRKYLAVTGGFAEVLGHSVSILARSCESAENIDLERANRAEQKAREALKGEIGSREFLEAEVKLRRASTRINIHGRRQV
jgi:F-type H+-transporting ATPase subunit epsilon